MFSSPSVTVDATDIKISVYVSVKQSPIDPYNAYHFVPDLRRELLLVSLSNFLLAKGNHPVTVE